MRAISIAHEADERVVMKWLAQVEGGDGLLQFDQHKKDHKLGLVMGLSCLQLCTYVHTTLYVHYQHCSLPAP